MIKESKLSNPKDLIFSLSNLLIRLPKLKHSDMRYIKKGKNVLLSSDNKMMQNRNI